MWAGIHIASGTGALWGRWIAKGRPGKREIRQVRLSHRPLSSTDPSPLTDPSWAVRPRSYHAGQTTTVESQWRVKTMADDTRTRRRTTRERDGSCAGMYELCVAEAGYSQKSSSPVSLGGGVGGTFPRRLRVARPPRSRSRRSSRSSHGPCARASHQLGRSQRPPLLAAAFCLPTFD
jgi:hypothetical protein